MQCRRTAEGLEWPITRKVDHDLRNWPPRKKKRKVSRLDGLDSKLQLLNKIWNGELKTMGNEDFITYCQATLADYCNKRMNELGGEPFKVTDFYPVWVVKVLQNNKALLSTDKFNGMYFELTWDGDKQEMYVDDYRKHENVSYV